MNTTSHLQTICLTENIRTDFRDLLSLVEYLHGDVRQCLLTLQFWLNSGGGSNPIRKDVVFNQKHCKSVTQSDRPVSDGWTEKDVTGQSHVKQECEDNSSKPAPVNMMETDTVTNEDSALATDKLPFAEKSSTSVVTQNTDVKINTSLQTVKTLLPPGESDRTTIGAHSAPLAHGLCFESILGPLVCCHGNTLQDGVLQVGVVWRLLRLSWDVLFSCIH